MLTPQDILDKRFDKVMVWGYEVNAVDSFLDIVEADYAALCAENESLKQRLEVLSSTVCEYRKTEASLRVALRRVHYLANCIIENANAADRLSGSTLPPENNEDEPTDAYGNETLSAGNPFIEDGMPAGSFEVIEDVDTPPANLERDSGDETEESSTDGDRSGATPAVNSLEESCSVPASAQSTPLETGFLDEPDESCIDQPLYSAEAVPSKPEESDPPADTSVVAESSDEDDPELLTEIPEAVELPTFSLHANPKVKSSSDQESRHSSYPHLSFSELRRDSDRANNR